VYHPLRFGTRQYPEPMLVTAQVQLLHRAALPHCLISDKFIDNYLIIPRRSKLNVSSHHKFRVIYCTMLGFLISSDHLLYRFTPLKTPFGWLLLLFQSQSHVTTFTHNYFLRCYTCTQLTITYTFVTIITCSTLTRLHSLRALHSNLYCTIAHKIS
jgi:hypothetical protein